jgi:hypothetical protein
MIITPFIIFSHAFLIIGSANSGPILQMTWLQRVCAAKEAPSMRPGPSSGSWSLLALQRS